MGLTYVEPYVVDTTANYTVANITAANVIAANVRVSGNLIFGSTTITANNLSSIGRSLYMGIVFGG